jgi:hypothetical protein
MIRVSLQAVVLLAVGSLGMCVIGGTGLNTLPEAKPKKNQIMLYNHGDMTSFEESSAFFNDVLSESKDLFLTADTSYRLIMSEDRIASMKKQQMAIEIKFSEIQSGEVLKGHKVHFTKLLIPLSGQFADGTVFFAGSWDRLLQSPEPTYASLQEYGPINFVRNSRGLSLLREHVKQMSKIVD